MNKFILTLLLTFQLVNVSAYTSAADECRKNDGITASGKMVKANHTIACDYLPFGTKVLIDGKQYTVEDRFGGGYTNRIDIYMQTKKECFEFGLQWKIVEILEEPKLDVKSLDEL